MVGDSKVPSGSRGRLGVYLYAYNEPISRSLFEPTHSIPGSANIEYNGPFPNLVKVEKNRVSKKFRQLRSCILPCRWGWPQGVNMELTSKKMADVRERSATADKRKQRSCFFSPSNSLTSKSDWNHLTVKVNHTGALRGEYTSCHHVEKTAPAH